jgi:hypothetical protein
LQSKQSMLLDLENNLIAVVVYAQPKSNNNLKFIVLLQIIF